MRCACGFESTKFGSGNWNSPTKEENHVEYIFRQADTYHEKPEPNEWKEISPVGMVACPKCGGLYMFNHIGVSKTKKVFQ